MKWKSPSTYTIAALLVLAIVVFLVLFQSGSTTPPDISLPEPINDSLRSVDDTSLNIIGDVTKETVQAVISTLSRAESYYRKMASTLYSSSGELVSDIEVWCQGEKMRIISATEDEVRNILMDDTNLYIWYNGDNSLYKSKLDSSSPDEFLGIVSYESIINLEPENIISAEHIEFQDESCIFVEYITGSQSYTYKAYISIATGLLMGDETWDGDSLIYSMVSELPDISTPPNSVFELPANLR